MRAAPQIRSRFGALPLRCEFRSSPRCQGQAPACRAFARSRANRFRFCRCRTTIAPELLQPPRAMSPQRRSPMALSLDTPVSSLAGIGPKRAQALAERGIASVADVIAHLPARYQDWRERTAVDDLKPGVVAVLEGELGKISERPM